MKNEFRGKSVNLVVRGWRIMSGSTREQLASECGVSARTVSRWESSGPIPVEVLSFLRRKWGDMFWLMLP